MITEQEFLEECELEIKNCKIHFTPDEKSLLIFKNLYPNSDYSCIYGLATGDCKSRRAEELISLCVSGKFSYTNITHSWVHPSRKKPRTKTSIGIYFTPLELLISRYPWNNKAIVNYINGKRKTLPKLSIEKYLV